MEDTSSESFGKVNMALLLGAVVESSSSPSSSSIASSSSSWIGGTQERFRQDAEVLARLCSWTLYRHAKLPKSTNDRTWMLDQEIAGIGSLLVPAEENDDVDRLSSNLDEDDEDRFEDKKESKLGVAFRLGLGFTTVEGSSARLLLLSPPTSEIKPCDGCCCCWILEAIIVLQLDKAEVQHKSQ